MFFQCGGELNSCFALTDFSQGLLVIILENSFWRHSDGAVLLYRRVMRSDAFEGRNFLSLILAASNQKSFDLSTEIRPPLASLIQETKSVSVEEDGKVHYSLLKKSLEIYHFCKVYKPVN